MLVYIDWLKEYTDVNVDLDSFSERMIMSGSNIENITHYGRAIEKVVVGRIEKIEKHPDADKLLVCLVDIGQDEKVQIVTGATNVFEGAYVPVILHGGKLPDGTKIKKGKLRGVNSFGMLCSAKELGYDDKNIPVEHKDGIWILDKEYPLGIDIVEALGLSGDVIEFEITPNRPDCLSMLGMAREVAATFKGNLRYPEANCKNEKGKASDYIKVSIKKPDLCRRYVARVVTDVKIGQSPWWLQKRLMYAGMRPINNIVDITNYVMLEYGQPIHAFDIRNIKGKEIIVDTAKEGELFTTLDGVERKLSSDTLLINDGERGIAIAGVMGGLNSEVENDTNTIVVESANFSGDSIRKTSKKLGLRTEASSRFEKGIDPNLAAEAADRVCKLIEMLGIGTVTEGRVDVYPGKVEAKQVLVRVDRVNKVLGINITKEEIEDIFVSLEMEIETDGNNLLVTPPTVRQDLQREEDFIEEVARIYGYDRLPLTLPKGNKESKKTRYQVLRDITKDALIGMGVNEVQTYSFMNPKGLYKVKTSSENKEFIRLINPLGEENSIMRTILTPNMLEVLAINYSRNIQDVKAFEIGNVFLNITQDEGLPTERENLCIACYGPGEDFFTIKGIVQEMLNKLGIKEAEYIPDETIDTYHPGRCAIISSNNQKLGVIGELHPDVLEQYDIDVRAYCCELNFDLIVNLADAEKYYKPLPKYPSTSRDIALLVDEEINVGRIESIIKDNGSEILEAVELFDVYRGQQVPEGKKSVAFTLTYRASDRTLTDEEVIEVHDKILIALKDGCNAVLRDM
ncbi:MAG: phenylalanine--tRNA ligase subunit beta [Clostridiales bacterium]|nr:phenylalanine--tRNA ligase subunit beta [Clostridiales bacterium]